MTKLDMSNNNVYAAGGKALAEALNGNQVMTELNLARNSLGLVKQYGKADMSGVMDIANTIPTMRALVKLDISSNGIKGEALQRITELCGTKGIKLKNESESESESESGSESKNESESGSGSESESGSE